MVVGSRHSRRAALGAMFNSSQKDRQLYCGIRSSLTLTLKFIEGYSLGSKRFPFGQIETTSKEVQMTQLRQSDLGGQALAEEDYQRQDMHRRDIVNHGISVQESSNTMSAIEYLKSHDIDPDVIERVLLEPQRRRGQTQY